MWNETYLSIAQIQIIPFLCPPVFGKQNSNYMLLYVYVPQSALNTASESAENMTHTSSEMLRSALG